MFLLFLTLLPAQAYDKIEVTPGSVSSGDSDGFSDLPSANHALFGFNGPNIVSIDFEVFPDGDPMHYVDLTLEFEAWGVSMNNIWVVEDVFQGAASGDWATKAAGQVFTLDMPATAIGVVNTSPDGDLVECFTSADASGTAVVSFNDQYGTTPDPHVDRFVGCQATNPGERLMSMRVSNGSGDLELDDLLVDYAGPRISASGDFERGEDVTISVTGANPGAGIWVGRSAIGFDFDRTCASPFCPALEPAFHQLGPLLSANLSGEASWTFTVPETAPLGTLWIQAAERGSDIYYSNVLEVEVLP